MWALGAGVVVDVSVDVTRSRLLRPGTGESEKKIATILDKQQQRRLSQIRLRLRGWRSLLLPKLAAKIGVSDEQVADVEKAIDDNDAALKKLQEDLKAGTLAQA